MTQSGGSPAPAAEIPAPEGNGGPCLIAKRFARDFLAAHPGDELVFVPGAVGGTSFWNHRWNPGDDLYDNLVALTTGVLAAHPAWRLRAMLFQGFETDAKNAHAGRRPSAAALDRFVESVRADLGAPDLPIVFGELPPGFVDGRPGRAAIRDEVRARAERLPYTAIASSRLADAADDDGLHYLDRRPPRDRRPLRRGPRRRRGERACRSRARRVQPLHAATSRPVPGSPAPRTGSVGAASSWQVEIMPTAPIAPYDESVTPSGPRACSRAVNRTPGRTPLYLLAGAHRRSSSSPPR